MDPLVGDARLSSPNETEDPNIRAYNLNIKQHKKGESFFHE